MPIKGNLNDECTIRDINRRRFLIIVSLCSITEAKLDGFASVQGLNIASDRDKVGLYAVINGYALSLI